MECDDGSDDDACLDMNALEALDCARPVGAVFVDLAATATFTPQGAAGAPSVMGEPVKTEDNIIQGRNELRPKDDGPMRTTSEGPVEESNRVQDAEATQSASAPNPPDTSYIT